MLGFLGSYDHSADCIIRFSSLGVRKVPDENVAFASFVGECSILHSKLSSKIRKTAEMGAMRLKTADEMSRCLT